GRIYKRYPHQLSGGQKQRIMIAMAMCNHPEVLIADEPTTALDATVQQEIIQLMQELQSATETAMIFITHDLALAAEIADDILVMQSGIPVEYGKAAQVLQEPQHPYTQALLSCRPHISNKGRTLPVIADFLAGNTTRTVLPQADNTSAADTLLSVRDLKVWYPDGKNLFGKTTHFFKAVNGISFDIREGTTLGLVGESGCGKSTTGKALMGLAPVRDGAILFHNRDIARLKGKEWNPVRREIQLIFQDPYASLNPRHTVGSIITEPLNIDHPRGNKTREAERLLDLVQLPKTAAHRYPHQFSGGQRQRIGIARALALHPRLLICDESVSALDVSVQAQVLNLLKELQYEMKLSYLFIAHDLSVVHYMSDEIIVMQAGTVVERGAPDDILLHPREPYTQKLVAAMPGRDASL
ncbi:MAG: ABC transporter ATP-binding protein, partial [Chitinophagaceae bacterium]|nr:ABC transporter ATP-binding protein [Chitinophagaceae bacterium]